MKKILILIILILFSFLPSLTWAQNAQINNWELRLKNLQEKTQQLKEKGLFFSIDPSVDARRLIDRNDWEKAKERKYDQPWYYYGYKTINAWLAGRDFIEDQLKKGNKLPINAETLKKIHRIVYQNEFFWGYEYRRVKAAHEDNEIDEKRMKELLKRMEKSVLRNFMPEAVCFSGVSHSELAGFFRTDPLDQLEFFGGDHGIDIKDFSFIQSRPDLFTIDESSVYQDEYGKIRSNIYFKAQPEMERKVEQIFQDFNQSYTASESLFEKFKSIILFQQKLVSLHPFLDGNGRTTRLMADYLLMKEGLVPPLYPNENDIIQNEEEIIEFSLKAMEDYLIALTLE